MTEAVIEQRESILDRLFAGYTGPAFAIRLWDGWRWAPPGTQNVKCTLVLRSEEAFRHLMISPTELTLGEAFVAKDIDVEGDLFSVFAVAEHLFHRPQEQWQRTLEFFMGVLSTTGQRLKRGKTHTPVRDREAISYHYDQPIEFYRPWLGETLAYSCAYFTSRNDPLDMAQTAKLELICRKLRLRPLERFLDIGCGWGSLVMHAASRHSVFAQGITLSREQARIADQRIEANHLTQSSNIELLDYRDAPKKLGRFDKIASVGMFEHVGSRNLPAYFRAAYDLLKPGGVFLNHGIARAWSAREDGSMPVPSFGNMFGYRHSKNTSFIDRYVFPDGELTTLAQAVRTAESVGFEVRDVENLREHYDLTLQRWTEALQNNADEVLQHVSERVYRIWLLYMAGCAAAFQRGDIALYQILLSRPEHGRSGLPLTRSDWYRATRPGPVV